MTTLLENLGYETRDLEKAPKSEASFEYDNLKIYKIQKSSGTWVHVALFQEDFLNSAFSFESGLHKATWTIESEVVLGEDDMTTLCHLVARLAPKGSTAYLQADGHVAGNVFVGLVVSFDTQRIPVTLVSADIGCGITMIPMCTTDKTHIAFPAADADTQDLRAYILASMRRSLKRGKHAEQGLWSSAYVHMASAFYEDVELKEWLADLEDVLTTCGIEYGDDVLEYASSFAQSLGSSGNHFMEMAVDDFGKCWLVVHSGSRALGAKVHACIAEACRIVEQGYEIATGALAVFYAKAYAALDKFAKFNRVVCALAVLDTLGLETTPAALKTAMASSAIFGPAIAKVRGPRWKFWNRSATGNVLGLLGGLTHNGLKAFVNAETRQKMFILTKGAVCVDARSSSVIVALRAGEGCVVFTLADRTSAWKEVPVKKAVALDYTQIYAVPDGVICAGHGAGRCQSTTTTAKMSSFDEIFDFFDRNGIAGNIAPGVLGDNPEKAYKPSSEIIGALPLDRACTTSRLRTVVAYKEGLSYNKDAQKRCAAFIAEKLETLPPGDVRRLWLDLNTVAGHLGSETYSQETIRNAVAYAAAKKRTQWAA